MIINGKNSVYEAINSGTTINKILINNKIFDTTSKEIVKKAKEKGIRVEFVDKKVLDKYGEHHQGYVAEVTDFKYCETDDILQLAKQRNEDPLIVILDGIEDPHNLGSIVRVCECVGAHGIIIQNRRCCAVNDTVFKTSCGAINHVKIARVTNINDEIQRLKEENVWVFATDMDGDSVFKTNLKGAIAVVIGSEGKGISQLTKKLCDGAISLPMFGKVNSLNASTATSAVLYEIIRQRN